MPFTSADRIREMSCGCRYNSRTEIMTHYCWRHSLEQYAAQHRVQLTAFGVGMLAFIAGFGICWFVFVR